MLQKVVIVVWGFQGTPTHVKDETGWYRMAIIRGGPGANLPVIPVVLSQGHYYGLRLPAGRKQWPKDRATNPKESIPSSQTVEDADIIAGVLRGGGRSDEFHTPKKREFDIEDFLKPFSSAEKMVDDCLRTCSPRSKSARRAPSWTCPICSWKVWLECRKKGSIEIAQHLRSKHQTVWKASAEYNGQWRRATTNLGLRKMHDPIDFEDCEAKGLPVLFPCPYCDLALPKFYEGEQTKKHGWIIRRSKTYHLKMKCVSEKAKKKVSLYQYWLDALRKHKRFYKKEAAAPKASVKPNIGNARERWLRRICMNQFGSS